MKNVLFVSSYRKGKGISPFILSQGDSLSKLGLNIDYYQLEGSGFLNYFKSIFSLRKKTKKKYYDIIHAHFGLSGIITRLSLPRKKVIVSNFANI